MNFQHQSANGAAINGDWVVQRKRRRPAEQANMTAMLGIGTGRKVGQSTRRSGAASISKKDALLQARLLRQKLNLVSAALMRRHMTAARQPAIQPGGSGVAKITSIQWLVHSIAKLDCRSGRLAGPMKRSRGAVRMKDWAALMDRMQTRLRFTASQTARERMP